MISVRDTGLGIKQDDLSKLFKEFSKVNNMQNTALNSRGIGLGLLISNKIAHQLNESNGGIKVESELGKGSIFSFRIIDKMIEEKEFLMSASDHNINEVSDMEFKLISNLHSPNYYDAYQISEMECKLISNIHIPGNRDIDKVSEIESKLISNVHTPVNHEEAFPYKILMNKLSFCESNSVKTLPEVKTINKMSGLIEYDSPTNKQKINNSSDKETHQYSKSLFFRSGTATPKSVGYKNENDFKQKDVFIEEWKKNHISSIEKTPSKNSENHFFFKEAATFTRIPSINYFVFIEEFIGKKKDFIIQQMQSKCSCPYLLAVDDNDFNNLVITMHANQLEIPIVTALSGCEALKKIEERQKDSCCPFFKLIFMDIEMPIMNGLETFEHIKKWYEEKEQKLHVVPITGHSEGNEKLELAKKIMGEAIFKPISLEYFVIFLEKYMKENL